MKQVAKAMMLVLCFVILIIVLSLVIRDYIVPLLPLPFQKNAVWLAGGVSTALAILAALAQITGLSIQDVFGLHKKDTHQSSLTHRANVIDGNLRGPLTTGDIVQDGSIKVVVGASTPGSTRHDASESEKLIERIHESIHENSRLPYALGLCLELCARFETLSKYHECLTRELTGYGGWEKFRATFPDAEAHEQWLDRWAGHRLIRAYVMMVYTDSETGQIVSDDLPIKRYFVGLSVLEIVSSLQKAHDSGLDAIYYNLRDFDEAEYYRVRDLAQSLDPHLLVPPDLMFYLKASDFAGILNGTRRVVLNLLGEVGRIRRQN